MCTCGIKNYKNLLNLIYCSTSTWAKVYRQGYRSFLLFLLVCRGLPELYSLRSPSSILMSLESGGGGPKNLADSGVVGGGGGGG